LRYATGLWVVERSVGRRQGEVASKHIRRRHGKVAANELALCGALEVLEKEELLFASKDSGNIDRTADIKSELIEDILGNRAGVV